VALRVVTLNVWGIPVLSQARRARLNRLPGLLKSLTPDVVCLQELWWKRDATLLMRRMGFGWRAVRSAHGGLLICTPHPVSLLHQETFPWDWSLGLEENVARKGMLAARVVLRGHPLCVATTHAALRTSDDVARVRQVGVIRRVLTRTLMPTILAGDFNAEPLDGSGETSLEFRTLREGGFQHVGPPSVDGHAQPRWVTSVGWPRDDAPSTNRWRDHVFLRDGAKELLRGGDVRLALNDLRSAVSDHNALVVDLTLHTGDRSPSGESLSSAGRSGDVAHELP
jgi:endonuclease/exonuclease/phosphatase family metal-dependent hydrolase